MYDFFQNDKVNFRQKIDCFQQLKLLIQTKKAKENFSDNFGHNILRHFDVDKIFLSPQVKRMVIISSKQGIYEWPHDVPNDLRPRTLGN